MRTRISERRIVMLLLAALVGESVLLLAHLGVLGTGSWRKEPVGPAAGAVVKSHRELRRRAVDSLIWENATLEEPLYFHDSVLTLNQSTASLRLFPDTDLRLSENTLVTIEPPLEGAHGEIRLKFHKGNLQARNPYRPAHIAGDAWTVDVRAGSDLEFRQVGDQEVEVRVSKGEAQLKAAGGTESVLRDGDWLRVEQGRASKLRLDGELGWTTPPPARIYAHAPTIPLALAWRGSAARLVIQTLGQAERALEVNGTSTLLELPLGQHRLFLRAGAGQTSEALDVEVWRAPVVHLLQPLPRDRVELDREIKFGWLRPAAVKSYSLVVGERRVDDAESPTTLRFTEPTDVRWSVYGRDEDGFEIPPPYAYPLFIRERPLAAPKLKEPAVRRPAAEERGASLWTYILPSAYADEMWEAEFNWEDVPGADVYALEISRTPDFREPVLLKTVGRARFVWRGFEPGEYYWRVAAGSKRGRLGVFSEPAVIDLREGAPLAHRKPERVKAAVVTPAPKPPLPPTATGPAMVPARMPAAAAPSIEPVYKQRWLAWTPAYRRFEARSGEAVRAKFSGAQPLGFAAEVPFGAWRVDATYESVAWRPYPESEYQSELRANIIGAALIRLPSWWGYGLELRSDFGVSRRDAESLESDSRIGAGPVVVAVYRGRAVQLSASARATLQSGDVLPGARALVRTRMIFGVTVGAGADISSRGSGAFGLLGFEY